MKETFRCEYVRCGNKRCKSCPHGPYWYGYKTIDGKLRKTYYGRKDPRHDPLDAIFDNKTASSALACKILGIPIQSDYAVARSAFRRLSMLRHPDRGGSEHQMKQLNSAWSYLCQIRQW